MSEMSRNHWIMSPAEAASGCATKDLRKATRFTYENKTDSILPDNLP